MSRQKLLSVLTIVFAFALLLAGIPLVGAFRADEEAKKEKDQPEPPVTFYYFALEPFNEKFRLNWKPVRPDQKHVSLTRNKGKLTITTQQGTIHADEQNRNEPKAKNIYLINNPLAGDADFEILTCISGFTPKQLYQQAGLLCYDDDDNYIKLTYEFDVNKGKGTDLALVRETNAVSKHDRAPSPADAKKLWLRLTRRKGEYEYASSGDGKTWTVHGEVSWGDKEKAPARMGIIAKNGGQPNVPEVDVCFERFQLRSPPPAAPKKE
jgi:regulation of enolase protein 1 (concanavalin A-like superfamily)